MNSTVDLRGFVYQLQPVLSKNQWKMESLQAQLAVAQKNAEECNLALVELEERCKSQTRTLGNSWNLRLDTGSYRHGLLFLAKMRVAMEEKRHELGVLHGAVEDLKKHCIKQQQKLELIDSHRDACLDEYVSEQRNLQSAEADRDWSARSIWRAAHEKGNGRKGAIG